MSRWKAAQENPPATSIIWQDPSSYDPTRHGPPYLPPAKTAKVASLASDVILATGYSTVDDALPAILVLLRAVAVIHQTNHWVTSGSSYYADHQLFERLYGDLLSEIDQVAERAVGKGQKDKVADARSQMTGVQRVVSLFYPAGGVDSLDSHVESSLRAETHLLKCISRLSDEMEVKGILTKGTDNLIAGIQDKHEEHLYLLQQRLTDDWKV
jgi:DNA-binding ferritin-like protein